MNALPRSLALALLLVAPGAMAASNISAQAPAPAKEARVERLAARPADMVPLRLVLALPDVAAIEAVKTKNAQPDNKRLQIGIGRDVPPSREAGSAALAWRPVPGGMAAHWEVVSPTARALRVSLRADRLAPGVEIRFSGSDSGGTVHGPVGAVELLAQEHAYWSPVLDGERALIEVFIPGGGTPDDASCFL